MLRRIIRLVFVHLREARLSSALSSRVFLLASAGDPGSAARAFEEKDIQLAACSSKFSSKGFCLVILKSDESAGASRLARRRSPFDSQPALLFLCREPVMFSNVQILGAEAASVSSSGEEIHSERDEAGA